MQTTCFSAATLPDPRSQPSPEPVSDAEARRIAVRQAGWRVRQAERRLGAMLGRLRELAPDSRDHAAALAEMHRCERALFNRQLELREACIAVRRHLPRQDTLDPGGPHQPRVPLLGE